jgi:undecaprenyl-diphosphatase
VAHYAAMTYFQAIVLALVQALTEFLPISSSGHLILVPRFLGWPDQGLAFDIATNTGTLVAVLAYFRQDLLAILRAAWVGLRRGTPFAGEARLGWSLALGTVPVVLIGALAYDWIAREAREPRLVAIEMIVFALVLLVADRFGRRERGLENTGVTDTLVIGCAQALALLPGTSRSGITMSAGLFRGLTREAAARYSFLLSVPVGLLAAGKDLWELAGTPAHNSHLGPTLVAVAVSAVAGYFVIGGLLAWVRRWSFVPFVVYRVVLGLGVLWWV